ncbi:MAG TPA: 16S rRNA (adenine(1518)-N(6)/adenine(1519)-N(6))-dimethyltransferase RsmA [Nitrosopumilaceae archaeon]|jgi:16S rRNA (adenine1518-N6/adenine1519-N6)-dimethyltransferase|nr:16S rRNA (adenine(1518)-N(6)/adenine(1519)-N(6))-dimethyltransferase RsmA [Nitrosopumilaceae archaeon]
MNRRRLLGQHFLVSESIAKSIVDHANITKKDTVLEIGTGRGILLPFLCQAAKKVISVETDKELYLSSLEKFESFSNLSLKHGDGFKLDLDFTIFVSNLPYSKSRKAIEWLAQKKFSHAIIMVQKEFAEKLLSKPGNKNHRAVTVLANCCAEIERIMYVKKSNFSPPPKVDSVVLRLTKTQQISKNIINTVNKLFSYRKKTIRNVAKQFGISIDSNQRFEDLTDGEIVRLAKQINKK